MPKRIRDSEERRQYQRKWERERRKDPEYRKAHNARKNREQKAFRRKNPELQKQRDRRGWLSKAYGVTPDWYATTLAAQDGVCAICGGIHQHDHWRSGKIEALHVDHNHDTKAVRGILCTSCNRWLGNFEIILKMLGPVVALPGMWAQKALAYLAKYQEKQNGENSSGRS